MAQPYEIGVEILEKAEDVLYVLIVIDPAGAIRSLRMHVGALQKDWLAIQQNSCAVDANITKANIVSERILA